MKELVLDRNKIYEIGKDSVSTVDMTVNVCFWFWNDKWNWFAIDEFDKKECTCILEQLIAQSVGFA